jgi:arsenate reductase
MKKVLVLCTGNSCRSQMAEGLINNRLEGFQAFSAGTKPSGYVHPKAIQVMAELGIDLSQNESKSLDQFRGQYFDYVITVCDSAKEDCPVWLDRASDRYHIGFDDPAKASGTEAEILAEFRRVRDEIGDKVLSFLRHQSD